MAVRDGKKSTRSRERMSKPDASSTTLMSKQMDRFLPLVITIWLVASVSFVYFPVLDGKICNLQLDDSYDETGRRVEQYVSIAIAGAACCSLVAQIIRHVTNVDHVADNGSAISIIAFLTTSIMASQQLVNALISPRLCIDAFGLITPLSQWIEWMISVPMMMYLNVTLDPYKDILDSEDLMILVCTECSIFVSFLSTTSMDKNFAIICVMIGTISMIAALNLLVQSSMRTYYRALRESRASENDDHSDVPSINLKIGTRKLLATIYLCIALPLFPVVFFAGWFDALRKLDVMSIIMIMNFLCKHVFALVLTEFRLDMMDPNKLALSAERVADSARKAFLRYVFHEVRVPLNSITMGLHLLKANPISSRDSIETIEMMSEATHFMSETLNDVLSIQKIEEGKLDLDYHICEVDTILRNAYNSLRAHIGSKGPKVSFIKRTNIPKTVIGDRFRLEHVLANVISNALKFSPKEGKVTVVVNSLSVHTAENRALIDKIKSDEDSPETEYAVLNWSVFDEGTGVKTSEQSDLFDPYTQLHLGNARGSKKTSGVSLSICKEIIGKHNGVIGVRSDPDVSRGSEFYVTVPVKVVSSDRLTTTLDVSATKSITSIPIKSKVANRPEEQNIFDHSKVSTGSASWAPRVSTSEEAAAESKGTSEIGAKNVMVVDDVSSNRKLLLMLLKKAGDMNLDSAACGEEAIEKYKSDPGRFDIILMDNIMPDMTGLEASRSLREYGYKNLLIGVTGNAMDADLEEFVESGADMAVAKPIKYDILTAILSHCEHFGCSSPSGNRISSDADLDRSRESLRAISKTL